jgi:multidrug efflux pump
VIFIAGLISMFGLPISEYPEVVPPSVVVRAIYPGANPRVISEAVATPLEEQVNGVENMLYMSSQSTSDGVLTLTVTFRVGTDPDLAQVQVQNRVSQALPRLPEEVRQLGVTTVKSSPNFIMVVHLLSPDNRYDVTYLRNYGLLQVKDVLAGFPASARSRCLAAATIRCGVARSGEDRGSRARGHRRGERHPGAERAGCGRVVGGPPMPVPVDYQLSINARGGWPTRRSSATSSSRPGTNGELTRLQGCSPDRALGR